MNTSLYSLVSAQGNAGPFSFEQIKMLLAQGQIQENTLVQCHTSESLLPLKDFLALDKTPAIPVQYANFTERFFISNSIDVVISSMLPICLIAINDSSYKEIFENLLLSLYYSLTVCSKLQGTIGQYAIGLKVTNLQGKQLSLMHSIGYFLVKIICCIMTVGLGCFTMFFTPKKQMLHDIIARVVVIKKQ